MMLGTPLLSPGRRSRSGFTLIELLIVITIIAILASLMMGAANRIMARAEDVRCRAEIAQLSEALSGFKSKYGRYPPSSIATLGPLSAVKNPEDRAFMLECWPRLGPGGLGTGSLTGDQALVFFLGGQYRSLGTGPDTLPEGVCLGFSTDPTDPMGTKPQNRLQANSNNPQDRIAPFYEFISNRLDPRVSGGNHPSYIDSYDRRLTVGTLNAYLYFSSGRLGNDYRPIAQHLQLPYKDSSGNWIKPDSFQIISAGSDGLFGQKNVWNPGTAETTYPVGSNGHDDMTNFYGSRMGYAPH